MAVSLCVWVSVYTARPTQIQNPQPPPGILCTAGVIPASPTAGVIPASPRQGIIAGEKFGGAVAHIARQIQIRPPPKAVATCGFADCFPRGVAQFCSPVQVPRLGGAGGNHDHISIYHISLSSGMGPPAPKGRGGRPPYKTMFARI